MASSFRKLISSTTMDDDRSAFSRSKDSSRRRISTGAPFGSKPWLNSQAFVSTGLRQLDDIVGGGLLLGSVNAIQEDDMFGAYAETLLLYRSNIK